jgi:hypothetical protein
MTGPRVADAASRCEKASRSPERPRFKGRVPPPTAKLSPSWQQSPLASGGGLPEFLLARKAKAKPEPWGLIEPPHQNTD